jgi:hypothetical protein
MVLGNSLSDETSSSSSSNEEKQRLEQQRDDTQEALDRISAVKNALLETPFQDSDNNDSSSISGSSSSSLQEFEVELKSLEQDIQNIEQSFLIPPKGLSMEEYENVLVLFFRLPFSLRWALCCALEVEDPARAACDLSRIPDLVTLWYQQRAQLTPQRLKDAMKTVDQTRSQQAAMKEYMWSGKAPQSSISAAAETKINGNNPSSKTQQQQQQQQEQPILQSVRNLFLGGDGQEGNINASKSEEDWQMENNVKNLLGRVTRKEGMVATQQDLDRLLQVLAKQDLFAVTDTQAIPGGFVIRGQIIQKTRSNNPAPQKQLLAAIDRALPSSKYPAQVSWMNDITTSDNAGFAGEDPVLVLLHKDMTPLVGSGWTTLCSTAALLSAFLFCVGVFGSNEVVTARLSESQAIGDSENGVAWFTNQVMDVLVPVLVIQGFHEVGHLAMAKLYQMETTLPTLLPFWSLPTMGAKTSLTTSPPDRTALFDFAIMGPLLGFIASGAFLAIGLQFTAAAEPAALQYFPALPVSLLKLSTLGGTLVDFFLSGGGDISDRFITMQDGATPIPLHPLAIAGFVSLLVNALAMLPLGGTDGGRLSLSIFGRYGHTIIGAGVWFSVLIASFTMERVDVLIGAWLINNIVQNDMEIPCRDEVSDVSLPRVLTAFTLWFITVLAIVPLS